MEQLSGRCPPGKDTGNALCGDEKVQIKKEGKKGQIRA